jgi:hypothetical protein
LTGGKCGLKEDVEEVGLLFEFGKQLKNEGNGIFLKVL